MKKKKQKPIITTRPKVKTFKVADAIAPGNTASGPDNDLGKAPIEGELLPLAPALPDKPQSTVVELPTPEATEQKPLRAMYQLFVDAYIIKPNAKQAAITAGYSAKTAEVKGAQLLTIVKVKAAIEEAQAELSKKSMMDSVAVVNNTATVIRYCMQKIPELAGDGTPVMAIGEDGDLVEAHGMQHAMGALKGLDQLSRYYGLYDKDNKQRAGTGGATKFTAIQITFVSPDRDSDVR